MRRAFLMTGHNKKTGLPEHPSPMTSPRTPFFCVVKVSDMNATRERSAMGMVVASQVALLPNPELDI
jgi:hypothetical protein